MVRSVLAMMVFVVFLGVAMSVTPSTASAGDAGKPPLLAPPPLNKGPLSNEAVCKIYLDRFAYEIRHVNDYYIWDEAQATYVPQEGQKAPGFLNHWAYFALFLALDGTDEQVALTGLSRQELLRRVRAKKTGDGRGFDKRLILKLVDEGKWQTYPQVVAGLLKEKAELEWPRRKNEKISLGFDHQMDYGHYRWAITMRTVPQDFADPRILAGRPIKDWMAHWARPDLPVRACYAPDFSSDHHVIVQIWYAQCPLVFFGYMGKRFTKLLLTGQPLPEPYTSPLGHMDDRQWWSLRLTAGNAQFMDPQTQEYYPFFQDLDPAYLACVFKSPEALAFAARGAQAQRKLYSVPPQERTGTVWLANRAGMQAENVNLAYFLHKLCGGPEKVMTYAEAARKMHGTYWYRYHRYGVHRTPDKLVTVGWNAKARYGAGDGQTRPYDELTRPEKAKYSTVRYNGSEDNRVTQIVPDNDDLRPVDEDPLFVMSFGGITGRLYWGASSETDCRMDRTDALLSTAGRIIRLDPKTLGSAYAAEEGKVMERAQSYHSMTSFYDKTAISLARILEGKDGADRSQLWQDAFASCFCVDPKLPDKRDCVHADGTLDLKPMVESITERNDRGGYSVSQRAARGVRKSFASTWWCVNDRLGVATVGGKGEFVARVIAERPVNGVELPGVMIAREEPLQQGPVLVDMAAAYYTDTPVRKVAQLQKTLKVLDRQLPEGWKGLISDTPDGQRVMALARFYGNEDTAEVKLGFPEGAPVLEAETTIRGNTGSARFTFAELQSTGQMLVFYVSGGVTKARQIGDTSVELEGAGTATLKYLSRAQENEIEIDGKRQKASKAQLQAGISVPLSKGKRTLVRIFNQVDEDYLGPAVEVTWPQYLSDAQCKILNARPAPWDAQGYKVGAEGLVVKVEARDRSGVDWVDVYLDWERVGHLTKAPYQLKLTKEQLPPGPHAFHAVACDMLGNENESFSVPVRVVE